MLPAFFANRGMSQGRPSNGAYLSWLGLGGRAEPVEIMVPTGGTRAADTFHVVDDPRATADGHIASRFLVSGARHVPGAHDVLAGLRPGQELQLRDEQSNPKNPLALLLDATVGEPVGTSPTG